MARHHRQRATIPTPRRDCHAPPPCCSFSLYRLSLCVPPVLFSAASFGCFIPLFARIDGHVEGLLASVNVIVVGRAFVAGGSEVFNTRSISSLDRVPPFPAANIPQHRCDINHRSGRGRWRLMISVLKERSLVAAPCSAVPVGRSAVVIVSK